MRDRTSSAPKTGAEYLRRKAKLKARRARNAKRQRELRAERDRKKLCRTCGDPVAKSKKTGKPARMCKVHLGADAKRKGIMRGSRLHAINGGSTGPNDRELLWHDQGVEELPWL